MSNFAPIPLACSTWDHEEMNVMQEVITSGIFTMGDNVQKFEKQFALYHSSKYCVMVNSGSSANFLMIAALFFTTGKNKLKRGDEVIVPSVSWSTSYSPLYYHGLILRFVDVDKDTLNISAKNIKNAITKDTKAVMAVNLLGNSCEYKEIISLCEEHNLILLEDNCESLGAEYENKKSGTFGLVSSCSSFFSHHISTMEGGLILTDDEEIYHILLSIRAHGWTRNLPEENFVSGIKSDDKFEEAFKFVLPGYNVRPLEISGAVGREQLKKLKSFINMRRSNASFFVEKFEDHPYIVIQKEVGESSWFGFSLVLNENSPISRDELVSTLHDHSIECRPIVTGNFLKNIEVLSHFEFALCSKKRTIFFCLTIFINSIGFIGN